MLPVHLKESLNVRIEVLAGRSKLTEATTWLARPSPGPWRCRSVLHCCPLMLIGGCQSVIHAWTHAATSSPTRPAQRQRLREVVRCSPPRFRTRPDRPRALFLRSRSVIEDMVTGWLRGILGPSHGGRAARPLFAASRGVEDCPPAASATSFDHPMAAWRMPVWRPRQGCRSILARAFRGRLRRSPPAAPRACPRRTFARALAKPSDRCLSASRLPLPTARWWFQFAFARCG